MQLVNKVIEISAAPEVVRQKFLDFPSIFTYHPDGFIKTIKPARQDKPIEAGDRMLVELEIGKMEPIMIENSPDCFSWGGSLPLNSFNGNHSFRFEPSATTPGGTTFTQQEEFTGYLSFIVGEGVIARSLGMREKTEKGFEKFNKDLKAWCEMA
ncbi:hypothetical protein N7448_005974 [Penicillium atrosanguineum]|uniref:Uncharacterized protein n=1 Tax=Penicillium atrosanguineum TaxID=1132637 RepID=A0A9W9GYT0_9EURO|nr:uncharacterized protein N7443_009737 [Penicillium atrosanguineum]KAJ5131816.1 hypothetical protein N7448_005974 [Penicillium atrosanguineum]KAJ5137978.1 hypothetical protein N7526_004211 [Penicillium atrosanguineum]KAJ5289484.1 hypothetical protein N7443_009737 [Penicillium atrosanguineum]KAJ5307299.1 hypothetical protein N7476_007955 [Penicillium atrosanguineum]